MSIATSLVGPVVRASLADLVYDRLLEGVLSGTLGSGAVLNVSDLAKEFGVSPSPVREALLRLAADGLVDNATNRRAMVVSFTRQAIIEIFQVREILEVGAARLAAERVTADQLTELRQVAADCAALFGDSARKKQMLDLDHRFHTLVAEASGNESLKAEITRCSHRVRVLQWLRLSPADMHSAYPEHLAILAGLSSRDPLASQSAMSQHIQQALTLVLQEDIAETPSASRHV